MVTNSGLGVGPATGVLTTSESTRSFLIDFSKTPTVGSVLNAGLYPQVGALNSWDNLLSLPATIRIKEVHVKVVSALSGTLAGTETVRFQVNHPRLGAYTNLTSAVSLTATAGVIAANTYNSAISDQSVFNRALTRFNGSAEKAQLQLLVSANDIKAGVLEVQIVSEFAYHNYVG